MLFDRDRRGIRLVSQRRQPFRALRHQDVQALHEGKRQAYQALLRGLVQEGIDKGSFRKVDPDLTVKILLSILSSVILTARPTGTPLEILNEGMDLIFKGLEDK